MRVLLIDDDLRLCDELRAALAPHGVALEHALDGPRGLAALAAPAGEAFDAVVLDVVMPGMDGFAVLREIRARSEVPVVMLSVRAEEDDRVAGFEAGANDYLGKPVSTRELLARLRRRVGLPQILAAGGFALDLGAHAAAVDGRALDLTGLEFDVLAVLVRHAGQVVSREALLAEAGRGDANVTPRAIDTCIYRIRKKVGRGGRSRIRAVRSGGYRLVVDVARKRLGRWLIATHGAAILAMAVFSAASFRAIVPPEPVDTGGPDVIVGGGHGGGHGGDTHVTVEGADGGDEEPREPALSTRWLATLGAGAIALWLASIPLARRLARRASRDDRSS